MYDCKQSIIIIILLVKFIPFRRKLVRDESLLYTFYIKYSFKRILLSAISDKVKHLKGTEKKVYFSCLLKK